MGAVARSGGRLNDVRDNPGPPRISVAGRADGRVPIPAVKIAVPRLAPRHVFRPRLTAALDRAETDKLVLVSAPAGYGKTLLLTEWVHAAGGCTAWVTLDADDDDRRFWSAVLAALESCLAAPSPRIPLPATPSRDPAFLAAVTAFTAVPGPVRLVLDDLQEVTAPEPLRGLARLIRNRPAGLQLVLATRTDPLLPLGRMRLTDDLRELRASDLAFSVEEARTLLDGAGVPTPPEQVQLLVDQTAGWAAGLRLAALSLRESADPDVFLTDLVTNDRAIADYLVQEILSLLPEHVVDVLAAVSVCDQVTAPLAAALSADPGAGDVLTDLERATSLVTSYGDGRRWFRVHPLLRAHLNADLQRRRPDLLATLNTRAAAWYDTAHEPVGALRHAREAGDPALLADLLRRHGAAMATQGHHAAVGAAVTLLEDRDVLDDRHVALVGALAQLEVGNGEAVTRLLERADGLDERRDDVPDALLELIEARRDWLGTDRTGAHLASVAARTNGVTRGDAAHLIVHSSAAMSAGRHAEAVRVAQVAVESAERGHNAYLTARATTALSLAQGMAGDLRGMTESAARAARTAPVVEWAGTEGEALNAVAWSYGLLMQARPRECLGQVAVAAPFAGRSHDPHEPGPSFLQTLVATFGPPRGSTSARAKPRWSTCAASGPRHRWARHSAGRRRWSRCSSTARRRGWAGPSRREPRSAGRPSGWARPATCSTSGPGRPPR